MAWLSARRQRLRWEERQRQQGQWEASADTTTDAAIDAAMEVGFHACMRSVAEFLPCRIQRCHHGACALYLQCTARSHAALASSNAELVSSFDHQLPISASPEGVGCHTVSSTPSSTPWRNFNSCGRPTDSPGTARGPAASPRTAAGTRPWTALRIPSPRGRCAPAAGGPCCRQLKD